MPNRKTFDQIKASILKPAMTSHYQVYVAFPSLVQDYLKSKNVNLTQDVNRQDTLNLSCVEASLPGSSLATLELTSDRTGVTERHVHRRMFDDRIDFTFLVDADEYLPIRAFEYWKEYITGGNDTTNFEDKNHFYRMNYPDDYAMDQGVKIVKFERDFDGLRKGNNGLVPGTRNGITYNFVRAFPIAVSSMPVTYDASSLLKCTVSMSYVRYYLTEGLGDTDSSSNSTCDSNTSEPQTTPALKKENQNIKNLKNELYNARVDMVMNRISADEFREIRRTNQAKIAALQNS